MCSVVILYVGSFTVCDVVVSISLLLLGSFPVSFSHEFSKLSRCCFVSCIILAIILSRSALNDMFSLGLVNQCDLFFVLCGV